MPGHCSGCCRYSSVLTVPLYSEGMYIGKQPLSSIDVVSMLADDCYDICSPCMKHVVLLLY